LRSVQANGIKNGKESLLTSNESSGWGAKKEEKIAEARRGRSIRRGEELVQTGVQTRRSTITREQTNLKSTASEKKGYRKRTRRNEKGWAALVVWRGEG